MLIWSLLIATLYLLHQDFWFWRSARPLLFGFLPVGLAYHAAYEFGGDVTTLPAGDVWLDTINQSPPQDRHLAVHNQHLVALNHADTAAWAAGSWKAIGKTTLTGSADEIGRRVNELAAQGITEIIYQPTGPDIAGELEAFHTTARTAVSAVAQDNPGYRFEAYASDPAGCADEG